VKTINAKTETLWPLTVLIVRRPHGKRPTGSTDYGEGLPRLDWQQSHSNAFEYSRETMSPEHISTIVLERNLKLHRPSGRSRASSKLAEFGAKGKTDRQIHSASESSQPEIDSECSLVKSGRNTRGFRNSGRAANRLYEWTANNAQDDHKPKRPALVFRIPKITGSGPLSAGAQSFNRGCSH